MKFGTVDHILAQLNPAQQEAVQTVEGPVLVVAGAGSGKTRVITYRIPYLLLTGRAVPENILQRTKQDSVAVALAQQVRERLFEHKGESRGLRFTYFQLRLRCNWIDRIRYCYRVVWTPTLLEWNVALPGFLFPLYFVLRPIRLARKYLSQLISEKL